MAVSRMSRLVHFLLAGLILATISCLAGWLIMQASTEGNASDERFVAKRVGTSLEEVHDTHASVAPFYDPEAFAGLVRASTQGECRSSAARSVPVVLLSIESTAWQSDRIDQVVAFVPNRYGDLMRNWCFLCRWTFTYILGERTSGIGIQSRPGDVGLGERDVRDFFMAASELWYAGRNKDAERFAAARRIFSSGDVFVGTADVIGRKVRLSGRQLEAMADLLEEQRFGTRKPDATE